MQLLEPSIKYKKSFLESLEEYQNEEKTDMHFRNEHYNKLKKGELEKNFQTYIDKELAKAKGLGLPKEYVPDSVYWLIDDDEYVGRVNIRHTLTENLLRLGGHIGYDIRLSKRGRGYGKRILELALDKAANLGIKKVLITCNVNNIASKKIIEANGGILENREEDKLRYWITIK